MARRGCFVRRILDFRHKLVIRQRIGGLFSIQRAAERDGVASHIGEHGVFGRKPERAHELALEGLEEIKRPAQKEHLAGDAAPLRQAGDRLIDDGLEDRGGDILLARTLV